MLPSISAGVKMSEDAALGIPAVWACVGVLADGVATLPMRQFKGNPLATKVATLVDACPLVMQPWAEMSLADFLSAGQVSLALRGNFFGRIVARDKRMYATQIQPLDPDWITVRRNSSGVVEYRIVNSGGGTELIPPDDVFHVRNVGRPGAIVGMTPIEQLRVSLGLAKAAEEYGAAFFQNSALPAGVLTSPEELDEVETIKLARAWLQAHQGINKSSLPAVLTGGVTWSQTAFNFKDLQFIEQRNLTAQQVAMIFRVPPHMISAVDRTTSWGCLPGETLVNTLYGPKPIADVGVGEEVWSLGPDGMCSAKVVGSQMTGHKPLLTFHTRGRVVRATPNHHMLVRRFVHPVKGVRGKWETMMVDARDVQVGDFFAVPHGFADGDATLAPNGRELTVAAMEFLGLYVGDGNRDGGRVEIAHGTGDLHLEYYRSVIESEFGATTYSDRPTRTRFTSSDAFDLLDCGFGGTAHTKRVPGWVFRLRPELQIAFLRGYLDADGSVQRGVIVYSSCNKALLEDVRHLCMGLGIPVGVVAVGRKAGPGEILGVAHQAATKYQLSLSSVPFNARIGSHHPHKAARLSDAPTTRRLRYEPGWAAKDNSRPPITDGFDATGVVFHRVTKIESSPILVPVYDIEVEGTHTFSADGVIVGNTGIEQQMLGFVRFTLTGYLRRWQDAFTALLPPGQFVQFDLRQLLRPDSVQRAAVIVALRNAGILNADECRDIYEDMPPIPGGIGQTYLQPLAMGDAGTPPVVSQPTGSK